MADELSQFRKTSRAAQRPASRYRRMSARLPDSGNRGKRSASALEPMFSCVRRNSNPGPPARGSRKFHVLARIHLVVEHERLEGIWFDHFLDELHIDWVLAKDSVLVFRFEIDRDEESPWHLWIDPFTALDAEHVWNFQKLHPGVHHHFLEIGGSNG